MREFKDLLEMKEEYSELRDCYDENDLIRTLDDLNRSREIRYLDENGIGTYDIKEAKVIKRDGHIITVEGKYTVELGIRNVTPITVYIEVEAELDEDGEVSMLNYSEVGWD